MLAIVALSVFIILVFPPDALAWGPATHLEIGNTLLHNISLISVPAKLLIERFPYDFLYGNISADIVVGKNLVEELKHCHNWKMGFKLLKKAGSDSQRAFAYGYLSHLAADTVAHNHFIPDRMIRTFSARTLRHIYWEMRFDALADKRVWLLPKKIVKEIHDDNDRLLGSVIEDAPLSFRTNKMIFSGILSLHRFERWHRMLHILSANSKWSLHREDKERYFQRSLDAAIEFLNHPNKAQCLKKDPTGRHALNSAVHLRKSLKTMKRQGRDWEKDMENALKLVEM
ncbi:MAG: zinc dependent phospholipase C family protein [Deltaproteobacteria bacterium]|nr:zinc dependent phospholipase C family protein [Deltaproteobacteria bacterium]